MRIDAHHHQWDLSVRPQPWTAGIEVLDRSFGPAELAPLLRDAGFDAAVLVHALADFDESVDLLAAAAADRDIAGVIGWVDLTAADAGDRLATLRAAAGGDRLIGVRHLVQAEADVDWLARPPVLRGLAAVAAAGLTFDVLVRPEQLPGAVTAARAVPALRFVVDHAGNPPADADDSDWAAGVAELARLPNVAVKLSGLVTRLGDRRWSSESLDALRPWVDALLVGFGPDRIMFGSDWPVCLIAAPYPAVVAAAEDLVDTLTPGERADVFGGTAVRWYELDAA